MSHFAAAAIPSGSPAQAALAFICSKYAVQLVHVLHSQVIRSQNLSKVVLPAMCLLVKVLKAAESLTPPVYIE